MSDQPVISVEHVGKAYRIWATPAQRLLSPGYAMTAGLLPGKLGAGLRRAATSGYRDFHALRDISFEVRQGEAVGIIGRNGSGKSTLLQIIAGTLQPTEGEVKVNGRVAALLELGSGFNPEFTGRENVYLNGAVLGLTRAEVEARFDAIAAFADIGDFIDQPVKTYSSGMIVRLAFAVQTTVHPEILIIDEALAVGDEAFQRKCYARMDALRTAGSTILLVTHAPNAVLEFCERCLFLHAGRLLLDGPPKQVIQQYHRLLYSRPEKTSQVLDEISALGSTSEFKSGNTLPADNAPSPPPDKDFFDPALRPQSQLAYASQGARIEHVRIQTIDGRQVNHLVKNGSYDYAFDVHFERDCRQVRFAHVFKTITGVELGGTTLRNARFAVPLAQAGQVARINIRFKCLLNAGTYLGNAGVLAVASERETYLHRIVDAVIFRVLPDGEGINSCYVDFEFQPQVLLLPLKDPLVASGQ